MKEFTYIIKDKNGLHARPAGMMASVAKEFDSKITVRAGQKEADGKRLLSLMSLGAKEGTELRFEISGKDEQGAFDALTEYCEKRLGGE